MIMSTYHIHYHRNNEGLLNRGKVENAELKKVESARCARGARCATAVGNGLKCFAWVLRSGPSAFSLRCLSASLGSKFYLEEARQFNV